MQEFDLESIHLSLKDAVNETLGDVAKDSIEGNNFQLLHIIAKIGIDVNSYIDGMFIANNNAVAVIDAELVDETAETDKQPEATNTPIKRTCIRGGFGVDINEAKKWSLEYLAKREGRAFKSDYYADYFKNFEHVLTPLDYIVKSGKPRWKQHACHAMSILREEGKVIKPKHGENDCYILTMSELKNQKAIQQAQLTIKFPSSEEGQTAQG